jgi:short-subunit dehydrogenase
MRKQGGGKIIYNSSILGFAAMQYRGAYNASKFAIEGFADTLRLEVKKDNIKVSLIEPGAIISDFRKKCLRAV